MESTANIVQEEGTANTTLRSLYGEDDFSLPPNDQDENKPTRTNKLSERVPPNVLIHEQSNLGGRFRLLQSWEGRVISIEEDSFTTVVRDRTNPEYADEEVEFDLNEVSPDDLSLLSEGAVFYWSIGYADLPGRPRTRISEIRFRRLPKWTEAEINKSRMEAERLAGRFSQD